MCIRDRPTYRDERERVPPPLYCAALPLGIKYLYDDDATEGVFARRISGTDQYSIADNKYTHTVWTSFINTNNRTKVRRGEVRKKDSTLTRKAVPITALDVVDKHPLQDKGLKIPPDINYQIYIELLDMKPFFL